MVHGVATANLLTATNTTTSSSAPRTRGIIVPTLLLIMVSTTEVLGVIGTQQCAGERLDKSAHIFLHKIKLSLALFDHLLVCVCVCVRERERVVATQYVQTNQPKNNAYYQFIYLVMITIYSPPQSQSLQDGNIYINKNFKVRQVGHLVAKILSI